jgi:hypothetical protein
MPTGLVLHPRRTSLRAVPASLTTWNGPATGTANGSIVPMRRTAARAAELLPGSFDHHPQPVRSVADLNHVHVGQPHHQCAHTHSTGFQAGAPRNSTTSTSLKLAEPLRRAWDQPRTITQPSDAENQFRSRAVIGMRASSCSPACQSAISMVDDNCLTN